MSTPRVSICLPNLNTRPFLDERMETILSQTFQDWELIICDSYSEDGAWEFFDKFRGDHRIQMYQVPREGIYAGWNECLRRARGEYCYIATSDDTMAPDCLEKLVASLDAHAECDLAHCPLKTINEDGNEIDLGWWANSMVANSAPGLVRKEHLRLAPLDGLLHMVGESVYWSITQLLIRRSLFLKVGHFESRWGSIGDFNWNMRATLIANTVHVPDTWGGWRVHSGQATAQLRSGSAEYCRKIEAAIDHAIESSVPLLTDSARSKVVWAWRSNLRKRLTGCVQINRTSRFRKLFCLGRMFVAGNPAARDYLWWKLTGSGNWPADHAVLVHSWLSGCDLTESLIRRASKVVGKMESESDQQSGPCPERRPPAEPGGSIA